MLEHLTGKVLELSTGFEPYRELGVLAGPILWELRQKINQAQATMAPSAEVLPLRRLRKRVVAADA